MRVFCCLLIFLCFSCSNNDSSIPDPCVSIIFDESKFNSSQNFGLNLIEYSLSDFCLQVKLGVSGCDDAHTIDMVSYGGNDPSDPSVVLFDFYDNNPQECEAYFIIDREFDLEPITTRFNEDITVMFRNNQGSVMIDI